MTAHGHRQRGAIYKPAMQRLLAGEALQREQAAAVMEVMMSGELSQPQSAALLTALAIKGVTAGELTGFAESMRAKAVALPGHEDALDTCGTGGSGMSTINTSTICAFVLAAAGVKVAKHGNRSSSGNCGSADVLEHLGAKLAMTPKVATHLLTEVGVTFLFAPAYHPAMKHVVPVRKSVGFRTVFNFLGPLCNPARTRLQVIGVSDARMAELMARALAATGTQRAFIAHADDGLDELSICGPTTVWRVDDNVVTSTIVTPADAELPSAPAASIEGGDVHHNAAAFEAIMTGRETGPRRDHVLLNAAAGLVVAQRAEDLRGGAKLAAQMIDTGRAWEVFCTYRNKTVALTGAP